MFYTGVTIPSLQDTWVSGKHLKRFNTGSTGQGSEKMWRCGVVSVQCAVHARHLIGYGLTGSEHGE